MIGERLGYGIGGAFLGAMVVLTYEVPYYFASADGVDWTLVGISARTSCAAWLCDLLLAFLAVRTRLIALCPTASLLYASGCGPRRSQSSLW